MANVEQLVSEIETLSPSHVAEVLDFAGCLKGLSLEEVMPV